MNNAGIYLHIPFCKTKCIYCDFYSVTKRDDSISQFIDCLIKEIELNKNRLPNYAFDTIFFGGGTPSVLTEKQLEKILNALCKYYMLDKNSEITLECNPGEINYEKLKNFRRLGINRLSIGFQSFNDDILKFLGRLHNSDQSIATYKDARKAGFDNINIDLIYDIPKQKIKDWKNDLFLGTSLEPEHISAYSLTVEQNTVLNSMIKNKSISIFVYHFLPVVTLTLLFLYFSAVTGTIEPFINKTASIKFPPSSINKLFGLTCKVFPEFIHISFRIFKVLDKLNLYSFANCLS